MSLLYKVVRIHEGNKGEGLGEPLRMVVAIFHILGHNLGCGDAGVWMGSTEG